MSYIVPREKPKRCNECPFIWKDTLGCRLNKESYKYISIDKQYANCPLIELKEHCDLIEKPKSLYYGGLVKIAPNDFVGIAKYFMDQINSQQVIIPAERSE